MERMIQAWQIKALYATASQLGMKGHGDDDELHQLVCGVTGKVSIKEMSSAEADQVLAELHERQPSSSTTPHRKRSHPTTPGGVSQDQQRKIWALMYSIKSSDLTENLTPLGERLCGIIKRQFELTAFPAQPFRWMNFEQGAQLIEILKQYDYNAAKRKCREGGRANAQAAK